MKDPRLVTRDGWRVDVIDSGTHRARYRIRYRGRLVGRDLHSIDEVAQVLGDAFARLTDDTEQEAQ